MVDIKVINGNNRQTDLLAYNPKTTEQYHVEVSVTHREKWCPTPIELIAEFDKKYFLERKDVPTVQQVVDSKSMSAQMGMQPFYTRTLSQP